MKKIYIIQDILKMKNRLLFTITVLLFVFVILYGLSNSSNKNKVEKEVLTYLKDKYHEEFKINSIKEYNYVFEEEYEISDAFVYEMEVSSHRLVSFKVYYYEYRNNSYEKNDDLDLISPGIYENYIYEYKIREIKNKYYKDILGIMSKSKNIEFSLDNIAVGLDNVLFKNRNDSKERIDLYDKYYSFNKSVSDQEFLDTYYSISKTDSLIITMDINDDITPNNIEEFKEEIRTLVKYLNKNHIYNYDINMNLDGYVNARATRYTDNNKEQIYLIFDYPSYYDTEDSFNVIIFDL